MTSLLIIDDEPIVRKSMRLMLKERKYEVFESGTATEGVQAYRSLRPSLLITDMILPDFDGVSLIIQICREFPDAKIIAISGGGRTGNFDYLNMAERHGARGILTKPFTRVQLLEAIDRVLEGSAFPASVPSSDVQIKTSYDKDGCC